VDFRLISCAKFGQMKFILKIFQIYQEKYLITIFRSISDYVDEWIQKILSPETGNLIKYIQDLNLSNVNFKYL